MIDLEPTSVTVMTDLPINQVLCGDCVELLKALPTESIDCVVTDPPYGIGFMGKDWDMALPPKEAFSEMFRVLKSGALAFVMSSPRQDVLWRMLSMLEGVGFEMRQSFVSWIYKSGFPKAYDVSKGIDRKMGERRKSIRKSTRHGGGRKPYFNLLGGKREDKPSVTEPATPQAKQWDGWKSVTGLKPALECVLMVNKPLSEKTIVDNVLRHGTGGINVDACRIPFQSQGDLEGRKRGTLKTNPLGRHGIYGDMETIDTDKYISQKGRFPANLLVSDGALDTGKITKARNGFRKATQDKGHTLTFNHPTDEIRNNYGDVGDQSRYFDLDAWSRHHGFLDVPKASKRERNKGLNGMPKGEPPATGRSKPAIGRKRALGRERANYHPTVKPVKLMAYLIELGCPPEGIVLDPFAGSGSTLIAAHKLSRQWIGIEIRKDYVEIAKSRMTACNQKLSKFV